jgi:type VI secretion system protein ImpE
MQDVLQLITDGNLDSALQNTQQNIRKNPADPKLRILLFQLLCVLGQWDKALNQLNVLRDLDALSLLMVQTYEQVLLCEALRKQVFLAKQTPLIFGEPQEWIALMLEALTLENRGELLQAESLRHKALEQVPASAGQIDGVPFAWIADADSRLGPILEAMVNGRYYWIPFQQISQIVIEKPVDLRDMVWIPANFTWVNQGEASGLIPCRYPGSELADDAFIKLSRLTDWLDMGEGISRGYGQRLFATDVDDYALLDVRKIEFISLLEIE